MVFLRTTCSQYDITFYNIKKNWLQLGYWIQIGDFTQAGA
jgi:hypothetical protein